MFRPGGDYYAFEELDPSILKLLKEITAYKANTEVLDVGCGRGLLGEALPKMGCRVTGIESHPDAVAECKDRLDGIIDHDPTDMVLFIEHLGGQVRDFVGDGGRWALKVTYSDEGDTLQGKGGGRELLMTLLKYDNQWDATNDVLEDGRVALYEKNILAGECVTYIDFGLSVPTKKTVMEGLPGSGPSDLGELFQLLSRRGDLLEYEVYRRFYEIGSPEGLADLQAYLLGASD